MNFTGQNYAAKKYKRVRKILYTCMLSSVVVGIFIGSIAIIFGKSLLAFYVPGNTEAITYGYQRLLLLSSTYFLCGIMEVLVGQLRGLGKSLVPMFISILGVCAFRVFWIYSIFAINHDWTTLFISYPISWALTSILQFVCYIPILKKMPKKDLPSSESAALSA
jgi:Na+-driven multidrug efflux pump